MYFSMENTNIFQGNIITIQVFHLYLHNLLAFSPTIYKCVGPGPSDTGPCPDPQELGQGQP